jgi:ribonuclease P protein component
LHAEEEKAEQNCLQQMRKNLTKKERLKKKSEISRVFNEGRSVSCSGARLHFMSNGKILNRVVFIPARKFGNAVERNYLRRHAKEIYRQEKERFTVGYDIAVVFYPGTKYDFRKRKEQFMYLLKKAGMFNT